MEAAACAELHDSKCAEVAALPNVNEYARMLQMEPGPENGSLDEILEEHKIDEEARPLARGGRAAALSKEDGRRCSTKSCRIDDRKWLNYKAPGTGGPRAVL